MKLQGSIVILYTPKNTVFADLHSVYKDALVRLGLGLADNNHC